MEKHPFLCMIVGKYTGKTLLDIGVIMAGDEHYARSIAHTTYCRYFRDNPDLEPEEWAIESMELSQEELEDYFKLAEAGMEKK